MRAEKRKMIESAVEKSAQVNAEYGCSYNKKMKKRVFRELTDRLATEDLTEVDFEMYLED